MLSALRGSYLFLLLRPEVYALIGQITTALIAATTLLIGYFINRRSEEKKQIRGLLVNAFVESRKSARSEPDHSSELDSISIAVLLIALADQLQSGAKSNEIQKHFKEIEEILRSTNSRLPSNLIYSDDLSSLAHDFHSKVLPQNRKQ